MLDIKMLSNVASIRRIILTFFFLCASTIIIDTTNAATSENKTTIAQAILMDTEGSCDISKNLLQAKHFDKCNKVNNPITQFNYTRNDSDLFLCLALWDRSWKICSALQDKTPGQSIFTSASDFDAEIDRMIEFHLPEETLDICTNVVAPSDPKLYGKTQKFVSQLMNEGNCITTCHFSKSSEATGLHPMCLAIYRVDKEIEKIKTGVLNLGEPLDGVLSPPSENFNIFQSEKGPSSLESTTSKPSPHNEISNTENEKYQEVESNQSDDDESSTLKSDALDGVTFGSRRVSNQELDDDSNLTFIMALAVFALLCLGYLAYSYKRKMEAKGQQIYRGLDSTAEYDEYFNNDASKFEKFYQPTTIPVVDK